MEVPFLNLTRTTERIRKPFLIAVDRWLTKKKFILDENVEQFEREWAKFCGMKQAVGVSSGSDALYLSLKAVGVGIGDEVIVQGNAYNACVIAILRCGAIPKFVDVTDDLFMHQDAIGQSISARTKAIMVVHLYGLIQPIQQYINRFSFPIIEDCAQAHGYKPIGDIACFSFYPTKSLGAFGDAGAVVTNNPETAKKIKAMSDLGQTEKNNHQYFGSTMRLDPIQAIALLLQLPYLRDDLKERKKIASLYDKHFRKHWTSREYYPHIYPYFSQDRDGLRERLQKSGIATQIHYPIPVYNQPFYQFEQNAMRNSEKICQTELSLPLYIGLTTKQQMYVIDRIKRD